MWIHYNNEGNTNCIVNQNDNTDHNDMNFSSQVWEAEDIVCNLLVFSYCINFHQASWYLKKNNEKGYFLESLSPKQD